LFAQFREHYPDIRLDVVLANQALNLSQRDADVAIRATDKPPENLVGRRAATIAWALYGRGIDFPRPHDVDQNQLFKRNWVCLADSFGALKVVKFVHEHVPPERVGYKLNTVLGLAEAIEQRLGIGHLPCFIGDSRPGLARLAPPHDNFSTDLWLLTHADLRHSPRVRVFLDFLAAEIAKQRKVLEGISDASQDNKTVPKPPRAGSSGASRRRRPA
jgi:DNA-binding transcriptional LysR family regulator